MAAISTNTVDIILIGMNGLMKMKIRNILILIKILVFHEKQGKWNVLNVERQKILSK